MSIVNHRIHGLLYAYEHKREGKKVRCVYLGKSDDVQVVDEIPSKGWPVDNKCYTEGHKEGQEAEKRYYGEERYKELNEHIRKVVPAGQLAGSHTKEGKILIHKNIDPKYHCQIIQHERAEHKRMMKEECTNNKKDNNVHNKEGNYGL